MSLSNSNYRQLSEDRRQFDKDLELRQRAFELEQERFRIAQATPWYRANLPWLGPTLAALVAIMSLIVSNNIEQGRIISQRDLENTRQEAQNIREAEADKYERETRIILQATTSSNLEENTNNLQFFMEAGLIDKTSELLKAIDEFGAPTSVGPQAATPTVVQPCEFDNAESIENAAISNNRLQNVLYCPTPNKNLFLVSGKPRFVIFSFTANQFAGSALNYMMKSGSKASTHLIITRSGEVVQLGNFNERLWHAGRSSWDGFSGLNSYSVGITLENAGKVNQIEGAMKEWTGNEIQDPSSIETIATDDGPEHWQTYTETQLDTLSMISKALAETYDIPPENFLQHSDVSPQRKVALGPTFNMDAFRETLE